MSAAIGFSCVSSLSIPTVLAPFGQLPAAWNKTESQTTATEYEERCLKQESGNESARIFLPECDELSCETEQLDKWVTAAL